MADERDDEAGLAGIPLRDAGLSPDRRTRPWSFRLLFFMRALAAVELCKGLFHWAELIGIAGDPLAGTSTAWRAATVFFSVADLVAAVGLWLGAAWGVVIWLLAALGQILASSLIPHAVVAPWLATSLELLAMSAYVALSAKARREAP